MKAPELKGDLNWWVFYIYNNGMVELCSRFSYLHDAIKYVEDRYAEEHWAIIDNKTTNKHTEKKTQ